jgi:hypothetical protein
MQSSEELSQALHRTSMSQLQLGTLKGQKSRSGCVVFHRANLEGEAEVSFVVTRSYDSLRMVNTQPDRGNIPSSEGILPIRSEQLNLAYLQPTDKRKDFFSSRRHRQWLTLEHRKYWVG